MTLNNKTETPSILHLGIDVGSTTTKVIVLDPSTNEVKFTHYLRHHAYQADSVIKILQEVIDRFPDNNFRVSFCGSGGRALASYLNVPYIQEVVANALAVRTFHPETQSAIELGGQDAKMIFFHTDKETGNLSVSDMRMNGSCAGGTGAFIDEIAALLKVPIEEFNDLASQGTTVYDVSGRCGVYAKTDIQPLLNQGVPKSDIALSAFHAIAKQSIGGLAQGIVINPPVVFEGGPLTFNPTLIEVFKERLCLSEEQVIRPDHPETIVARGAALSLSGNNSSAVENLKELQEKLSCYNSSIEGDYAPAPLFFENKQAYDEFFKRHQLPKRPNIEEYRNQTIRAYLGIDSGSTTTKFALVNEEGELVDSFYSSNEGEPLDIATNALIELKDKYELLDITLEILGVGTTGYGELLFNKAYHCDYHTVETVAHTKAATKYVPETSFILDIGGQDMKAIWLDNGIITDIVVNEACSSGCGSFLEGFASSLNIPVYEIAQAAFNSTNPAVLGSRCTVFMNSSIVSEQKNGKTPDDIMAGLCRSIIENVFTKVIRVSNLEKLGNHIVVQGGTFRNDAVLRALEQYLDKEVTRAPYPGLMGAIGIALLTKEHMESSKQPSTFIGLDSLHEFTYTQDSGYPCPFCTNKCNRTVITFNDGERWVTGNRCAKGEVLGSPKDSHARAQLKDITAKTNAVPNMFKVREELLFKEYDCEEVLPPRNVTIGLPRVLALWDNAPFWTTFFRSLGFTVKISSPSSQKLFEDGLAAITSDTVCFPAKLVHGHLRNLAKQGVDRIFMPVLTTVESENTEETSRSMCAVVKGYPLVIQNSDNPERQWNIPFDNPLWHWYTEEDRNRQLCFYMEETFGIGQEATLKAIEQALRAQAFFKNELIRQGSEIIALAEASNNKAVILAGRPYHNDTLINHELPSLFTELGIPVLTVDSVPGVNQVDLSHSRLDIVNNFHARMLSCAIIAAKNPNLEYCQIVSFGCGHDAYLSDEIIRLMRETSHKTPLILKLDESNIRGPLRIRVNSFIESSYMKQALCKAPVLHDLEDPYPVKFVKKDRKRLTILVPNTSHAFAKIMSAALSKQGVKAEAMEVGREEAIALGKKYVHNDICFPAQMTIGESLASLTSGKYDPHEIAIGTGKYIGDCRLTHYGALLRKALDEAGFDYVPIITNDDVDQKNLHPGLFFSLGTCIRMAIALPMIDVYEELLRKIRPYEIIPGSTISVFNTALDGLVKGLEKHGVSGAKRAFKKGIELFKNIEYDRSNPKPSVLIVGEYLLNFHPGANHDIEKYLEDNGMEVIEARMTDVIRKSYFYKDAQVKEYHVDISKKEKNWYDIANKLFNYAHDITDKIAISHPLYKPAVRMDELIKASDPIIHHTFDAGEGVLIPGEILHHAAQGCRNFIILQPFACLPNHVVGRGISKRLKELYPEAQILPLDYDPDVSFANIENRLQMLIMNTFTR